MNKSLFIGAGVGAFSVVAVIAAMEATKASIKSENEEKLLDVLSQFKRNLKSGEDRELGFSFDSQPKSFGKPSDSTTMNNFAASHSDTASIEKVAFDVSVYLVDPQPKKKAPIKDPKQAKNDVSNTITQLL